MLRKFATAVVCTSMLVGGLAATTASASAIPVTPPETVTAPTTPKPVLPRCYVSKNDVMRKHKIVRINSCGGVVTQIKASLGDIGISNRTFAVYTKATANLVIRFQRKNHLPMTGKVNRATYTKLVNLSRTSGLPKACKDKKAGIVICANQRLKALWYTVHGKVVRSFDARFGSSANPTRNGTKYIFCKTGTDWSELYNVAMYNFMCIDGGQGIHGSVAIIDDIDQAFSDGGSHGCIGLGYSDSSWLYSRTPMGTKVVIVAK